MEELKCRIDSILGNIELLQLSNSASEVSDQIEVIRHFKERLNNPPIIVLLGLTNSGKSTLGNCLIGLNNVQMTLFPTAANAETYRITSVNIQGTIFKCNDQMFTNLNDLCDQCNELQRQNTNRDQSILKINIPISYSFINQQDICIIDTPGIDENTIYLNMIKDFLENNLYRAVFIMVVSLTNGTPNFEISSSIRTICQNNNLIYVLTMLDDYCRRNGDNPTITNRNLSNFAHNIKEPIFIYNHPLRSTDPRYRYTTVSGNSPKIFLNSSNPPNSYDAQSVSPIQNYIKNLDFNNDNSYRECDERFQQLLDTLSRNVVNGCEKRCEKKIQNYFETTLDESLNSYMEDFDKNDSESRISEGNYITALQTYIYQRVKNSVLDNIIIPDLEILINLLELLKKNGSYNNEFHIYQFRKSIASALGITTAALTTGFASALIASQTFIITTTIGTKIAIGATSALAAADALTVAGATSGSIVGLGTAASLGIGLVVGGVVIGTAVAIQAASWSRKSTQEKKRSEFLKNCQFLENQFLDFARTRFGSISSKL